jgi:hypothetical protein
VVIGIALGKADSIGGFGAGDDDLFDAEFAGCFDDIVGCGYVASEALVIWNEHVACVGCEMDDYIWGLRYLVLIVAGKVVMSCVKCYWSSIALSKTKSFTGEGVVDLTAVGQVSLECKDIVVISREVDQIEIQNFVALLDEFWDSMAASLAGTASEYNAFS